MTSGIHAMRPSSQQQTGQQKEHSGAVRLDGDRVVIEGVVVTDDTVVGMLSTAPDSDRIDLLLRMMSVGAQGVVSMGVGLDLAAVDARVLGLLESVTTEAEASVRSIIDESRSSLGKQFDPEQRSSILARALTEFTNWREEFLARLDPGVEGSTATLLIQRLQELVGPEGALETRLSEALDIDAGDSAFAKLSRSIEEQFEVLRRDLASERAADSARNVEAERGTAHGIKFEDVVEANLRRWAASIKGCIVERTTNTAGHLAAASKVGDFVITLSDGHRIVVEAKRHASISLAGSGGILHELDDAMTNRAADAAVCVAGRDAFPAEVGHFNVYGDRVLVVDEGDGAMTAIAMQWAATAASIADSTAVTAAFDTAAVTDRIDRIRHGAEALSGARRTVTGIKTSLDKLHENLGTLRSDVLGQVDDLDRLLCRGVAVDTESRGSEGGHS
jgi:hypothetical protein